MLWLTREFLTQLWVLSGNTNWASIQMTLTHHDATLNYQWSCCEAKLIRAQQSTDDYVTTCFHLAISLNTNTATQAIENQGLLCFSQAKLPW